MDNLYIDISSQKCCKGTLKGDSAIYYRENKLNTTNGISLLSYKMTMRKKSLILARYKKYVESLHSS